MYKIIESFLRDLHQKGRVGRKTLRQELSEVKDELLEWKDKYLRALAEFENYKKRAQREREDLSNFANERLIVELIGVLDDFERGLDSLKGAKEFGDFYRGVEFIYNNFKAILQREGLESFSGVGEEFDPRFHEAVSVSQSKEHPPNHIVAELVKGYKLRDKVIRPAKVIVSGE